MKVTVEIGTGQLAEWVKQAQAGNEVLLTQGEKLVAKLVPTTDKEAAPHAAIQVRSLAGHRVLTPVISQQELAEEIFDRRTPA